MISFGNHRSDSSLDLVVEALQNVGSMFVLVVLMGGDRLDPSHNCLVWRTWMGLVGPSLELKLELPLAQRLCDPKLGVQRFGRSLVWIVDFRG